MKLTLMVLSLLFSIEVQARRVIISGLDLPKVKQHLKKSEIVKIKSNQESLDLSEQEIRSIRSRYPKARIEEDVIFSLPPVRAFGKPKSSTTQPAQVTPWGVNAVNALLANNRGENIRVCVIDTGIDRFHPDFNPLKIEAYGVPGLSNKVNDDNGHGTHCSGTIAAQDNSIGVVGVAPQVTLISVKALNRQGSGYSSDLANAIDLCVAKKAKVISASWGSASYSSVIADAVTRAVNSRVYFVAAAGNEATAVSYPAALSQSIAISAVDVNMNFASFSNFGLAIDYAAPGVNILSTLPGGKYQAWNGTSMATPHAAGVIALMLSAGFTVPGSRDIGLPVARQGKGMIDASLSY